MLWQLTAACAPAYAQQQPLLLGTIESNYINWEQNRDNPYFAAVHFVKSNGRRQTADTGLQNNVLFSVFFKGKRLKQLHGSAHSAMEGMGGLDNCYRIPWKQVPITGKKSLRFAGWAGEPIYRPLVISSSARCKRGPLLQRRKPTAAHRLVIERFLSETAARDSLGPLPLPAATAIDTIRTVLALNDSCFLLEVDMRLNMYHYTEKVAFNDDQPGNWFSYGQLTAEDRQRTPFSWFLVNGGTVQFIGPMLLIMDEADYDGDGCNEILMKMKQHYNRDGYVLITDCFTTVFSRTWRYH